MVNVDGADLVWDVRAADTATAEVGSLELIYYVGDTIAKSQTWETVVVASASAAGTTEPPEDPARVWFDEIKRQIGDLGKLTTKGKENLVAAINEAAQTSSGGADPDDIAKAVADYLAAHPIEETDPTVPEWAKAAITGATVGQIAKIAAVDTDGVPTAWSPVDMPSGEGTSEASWHAWDNIIVPEGGLNAFDFTTLASGEKLPDHQIKGMFIYSPFVSSATESEQTATLTVNGDYIFNLGTFGRAGSGYLRILLMVENGQLVVRYYKRDTDDFVVFPATTVALNSQDLHPFGAISKGSVSVIGYGKTLKVFNQIQSVRIESSGQVLKGVEFDVQVLY